MTELVTWTNEKLDGGELHKLIVIAIFVVAFLAIHPFQDGNYEQEDAEVRSAWNLPLRSVWPLWNKHGGADKDRALSQLQYNAVFRCRGATMFQNPEITLDELPNGDPVEWERLHPLYVRALRVASAIVLTIIGIVVTALNFVPNIPLAPVVAMYLVLAIGVAIAMSWPGLSVQRRGYVLREHDILFRKGVIWHSVTAVPFNRIQHVETSSTPLDRKFGLATLQLFTAGGSGGDLKIGGLGKDVAERLRVFILNKAGTAIEHT